MITSDNRKNTKQNAAGDITNNKESQQILGYKMHGSCRIKNNLIFPTS